MTEGQIKHRAKQLGLKFDNKTWTEQEYAILDKDYGILSIDELMKKLPNRSKSSIISKASSRGLTSDRMADWSKKEDDILYLLYPEYGSKMFNKLPGKTKWQIQHRLHELNIKKSDPYEVKMNYVKEALSEGVVISINNQFYKGINLYEWKIYNKKKFTKEEIEIINKVIPNRKLNMAVKVIDLKTEYLDIYLSKRAAGNAICNKYENVKKGGLMDAIERRLSGQVTTPYKGRFMFYYATDEEVKKYLEDNKVS